MKYFSAYRSKIVLVLGLAGVSLGLALPLIAKPSRPAGGAAMDPIPKTEKTLLKKLLTPLQIHVTQEAGTEPPFKNEFWDNKEAGIYVDLVSGEPLFSSLHKYQSGTGWPSFFQPLVPENIVTRKDTTLGQTRVEVRSSHGDSHLGHLFEDGPAPTGARYCINSASLRFIPVEKLATAGYGQFLADFGRSPAKQSARAMATFAGGCFWGVEELIRQLPGVLLTTVGYTGGTTSQPTYDTVHAGKTGHAEAVQVIYDPQRISYEEILTYFFRLHDPTTPNRQGNDQGSQYRSVIFTHDEEQARTAYRVIETVNRSGKWPRPLVTEVVPTKTFYPAENYHQDYLQKNPGGYTCHYLRD